MNTFKGTYPLLENKRLFDTYPDFVCSIMEDMFSVKTEPAKNLYGSLRAAQRENGVSWLDMVKDAYQIGRGIAI
jgi:hypothetical protein